jgi:hypothetical protein
VVGWRVRKPQARDPGTVRFQTGRRK